jgi:hypothetical protein
LSAHGLIGGIVVIFRAHKKTLARKIGRQLALLFPLPF